MLRLLQTTMLGNWQTTLVGFLLGLSVVIMPILSAGHLPSLENWEIGVLLAIFGLVSKDHNKVGTGSMAEPIRGAKPQDDHLNIR